MSMPVTVGEDEASPLTGVWSGLVGQELAVAALRRAVAGSAVAAEQTGSQHAMTHAWLITGPPGSGRSNTARAFAAALQCLAGGCGECTECRTAVNGTHADVTLVRTDQLSIGADEVRELVRRAAMKPTVGRWQVFVVEDADRMTEAACNALLKSIEEPAARTLWLLCAPTADDLIATVRSRCRVQNLRTPSVAAVARLLQDRDGVDPQVADHAARAAQGHIGRARLLARDEGIRSRRREVLTIPHRLRRLGSCLEAAQSMVAAAAAEAQAATAEVDAQESAELARAFDVTGKGVKSRHAQTALKELAEQQRARQKRAQRDSLDLALTELTAYYRDVLSLQTRAGADLVNADLGDQLVEVAARDTADRTVRRIDAILACRTALEGNVAPLLAVEAMLIGLVDP